MWFGVEFLNGEDENNVVDDNAPNGFYVSYGSTFTLPQNTFTPSVYYEFDNWLYNGSPCLSYFTVGTENGLSMSSGVVGSTLSFTASWALKEIRIDLYSDETSDGSFTSEYVSGNEFIISSKNENLPFKVSHEIDYILDSNDDTSRLAYFINENNEFVITIPDITDESVKQESGEFYYELFTVWKKTLTLNANTGTSSRTQRYYAGVTYDKETYLENVVPVDVLSEVSFTLPTVGGESGVDFINPHMDFVYWAEQSNGSGETYLGEQDIVLTEDKTLYAIWVETQYTLQIVDETGINETLSFSGLTYGKSGILSNIFSEVNDLTTTDLDEINGYYVNLKRFVYTYNDNPSRYFGFNDLFELLNTDENGAFYEEDLEDDNTIILECVWEEKTYELVVNLDGGRLRDGVTYDEYDIASNTFIYEVKYSEINSSATGLELLYDGLIKSGYRFNGFAVEDEEFSQVTSISGRYYYSLIKDADALEAKNGDSITVVWQEIFTLTFDGNGGSVSNFETESEDVTHDEAHFVIPSDISASYPQTAQFMGWWYTNSVDGENGILANKNKLLQNGDSVIITRDIMNTYGDIVTNTVTLYAVWQVNIRFRTETIVLGEQVSVMGYYTPESEDMIEMQGNYYYFEVPFFVGQEVRASDLEGYMFVLATLKGERIDYFETSGWIYNENIVQNFTVTSPIILVAEWVTTTFRIYLKDYNGSDFNIEGTLVEVYAEVSTQDGSLDPDKAFSDFMQANNFSQTRPNLFGYTFIGWRLTSGSNPVASSEADIFSSTNHYSPLTRSLDLYASYRAENVRVVYDTGNDNAETGQDGIIVDYQVPYGSQYKVRSDIEYTLDYHNLSGWTVEGEAGTITYDAGQNIPVTTGVERDISGDTVTYTLTLRANWTRVTKTIQISLDGGEFDNNGENDNLEPFYVVYEGDGEYTPEMGSSYVLNYTTEAGVLYVTVLVGEGYKFKLPTREYMLRDSYQIGNYMTFSGSQFVAGNDYDSVDGNAVILNTNWLEELTIRVYANRNGEYDDSEPIIIDNLLYNDSIRFYVEEDVAYIGSYNSQNMVPITFERDGYFLSGYSSVSDPESTTIEINYDLTIQSTLSFNEENFDLDLNSRRYVDLYCQWEGELVSVALKTNDTDGEIIETDIEVRYGERVNISDYFLGDEYAEEGYTFSHFVDKVGTSYDSENYFFTPLPGNADEEDVVIDNDTQDVRDRFILTAVWEGKEYNLTINFAETTFTGRFNGQDYVNATSITIPVQYDSVDPEPVDLSSFSGANFVHTIDQNRERKLYIASGFTSSVDGDVVTNSFTMPACDVVLTLRWISENFTLIFDVDGSLIAGEDGVVYTGAEFNEADLGENMMLDESGNLILLNNKIGDNIDFSLLPAATLEGNNYSFSYLIDYYLALGNRYDGETRNYMTASIFNLNIYNGEGIISNIDKMWSDTYDSFVYYFSLDWGGLQYIVHYENQLPSTSNKYEANATGVLVGTCADETHAYGVISTLSSGFDLTGWSQTGWSTESNVELQTDENTIEFVLYEEENEDGSIDTVYGPKPKAYNLVTSGEDGQIVTLYPVWEQNEYSVVFVDELGNNSLSGENLKFKYDSILKLSSLYTGEIEKKTFSEYYYNFIGWKLANSSRVFSMEDEILFSTSAGGILTSADLGAEEGVTFNASWEEEEYTIRLKLGEGKYSSRTNDFEYIYDATTNTRDIVYQIPYSIIENGVDLKEYMGLDDSLISKNDFTFAGWSLLADTSRLDFFKGEKVEYVVSDVETTLKDKNFEFVFYAMYNEYLVTLDGNGGTKLSSLGDSYSHEDSVNNYTYNWVLEDNAFYLYTYLNASFDLPEVLLNGFEKDRYHILNTADSNTIIVTENIVKSISWEGNYRLIVLDKDGEGSINLNNFSFSDSTLLGAEYRIVEISSPDEFLSHPGKLYVYVYNEEETLDNKFVFASSYNEGETYFEKVSDSGHIYIAARNGDTISDRLGR